MSLVTARSSPAVTPPRSALPAGWRWLVVGALLALAVFGSYYGAGWLRGDDTSLLVLYRPGVGDKDYLPLARQIGAFQLSEGFTAGHLGEGWIGFPIASVLAHGLGLRLGGAVGFAVVDILLPCAFFLVAARLLLRAGCASHVAAVIAAVATFHGFSALAEGIFAVFGYSLRSLPFYLQFLDSWTLRFPRKFVSDIFVLGALGCWVELARHGLPQRRGWWIETALWTAAVVQSDVYSLAVLGLAFAALLLVAVARQRAAFRVSLVRHALPAAVLLVLLCTPFILQRLNVHPDLLARFGVFPFARDRWEEIARLVPALLPASTVFLSFALPWLAFGAVRFLGSPELFPVRLAAAISVLQLCACVAMPCFVFLLGQGVQLYHFSESGQTALAWTVLVGLGLLGTALSTKLRESFAPRRASRALLLAVAIVGAGLLVLGSHSRARRHLKNPGFIGSVDVQSPPEPASFREDWRALSRELARPDYAAARVLATTHGDIFSWWVSFRGGESYLAHGFISALPDEILRQRLFNYGRLVGVSDEHFIAWLTQHQIHSQWLTSARFQATPLYTAAPPSDYTAEERTAIAAARPLASWHLIVPRVELQRHRDAYVACTTPAAGDRPDLILQTNASRFEQPPGAGYALAYQNPSFRVYRRTAMSARVSPAP